LTSRTVIRTALRWIPLAAAAAGAVVLAGPLGAYTVSWSALRRGLDWLAPGHDPISDFGVSLYQLNDAVRRFAHAALACAVVVAVDRGPCARMPWRRRFVVAIGSAAGVAALAAAVRWRVESRHVRIEQWLPTVAGVVSGMVWVALGAGVRTLHRWASDPDEDDLGSEPETPPGR